MKETYRIPCRTATLFLAYTSFAVICQLAFIILNMDITSAIHGMDIARYLYIPYLEYPLVSVCLILGGALLIDYTSIRSFT